MDKFLVLLLTFISNIVIGQTHKTFLFVGTYTDGKPDSGIYIYEFDTSGILKKVNTGKNLINPSYLSISNDGNYLYACTESKMPNAGSVSAFKIDSSNGSINFINKQKSGGENPVYVTSSKNNEFVILANYTEGSVSVYKTNLDVSINQFVQHIRFEGSSINNRRQDKSHIHAAVFSPDYKYIFFPDLGTDKIHVFKFDTSLIQPLIPLKNFDFTNVPGSGPRHFTFHPTKNFAYCIEELSGTVTAFNYKNGKLDSIQRIFSYSKLQEEYNSADIHISPDGLFLYASNRWENENTISIFSIDSINGILKLIGHQYTYGDNPRNFCIDPNGNFLLVANQMTNTIIVFKRDKTTGLLTKLKNEIKVPSPSCLQMRVYGE